MPISAIAVISSVLRTAFMVSKPTIHCQVQYRLTINEMLDTLLAVVQSEEEWSAHANCCGTKAHALQDVMATADATVNIDFELLEDRWAVELAL